MYIKIIEIELQISFQRLFVAMQYDFGHSVFFYCSKTAALQNLSKNIKIELQITFRDFLRQCNVILDTQCFWSKEKLLLSKIYQKKLKQQLTGSISGAFPVSGTKTGATPGRNEFMSEVSNRFLDNLLGESENWKSTNIQAILFLKLRSCPEQGHVERPNRLLFREFSFDLPN